MAELSQQFEKETGYGNYHALSRNTSTEKLRMKIMRWVDYMDSLAVWKALNSPGPSSEASS
jgi:hypothetical protein